MGKGLLCLLCLGLSQPAWAEDFRFQSPSGNIHCLLVTEEPLPWVRCDLREAVVSYKSDPACGLDYGKAFFVGRKGQGQVVCAGDTVIDPTAVKLPYGKSTVFYDISCSSDRSGMTCRNGQGHGFTISRARQQVF